MATFKVQIPTKRLHYTEPLIMQTETAVYYIAHPGSKHYVRIDLIPRPHPKLATLQGKIAL